MSVVREAVTRLAPGIAGIRQTSTTPQLPGFALIGWYGALEPGVPVPIGAPVPGRGVRRCGTWAAPA